MKVTGKGLIPARVMIVGEAPSVYEENTGEPFVGPSGKELNRMLAEAGLTREQVYVTNVCRYRPPNNEIEKWMWRKKATKGRPADFVPYRDVYVHPYIDEGIKELVAEIEKVKPTVIVPMGNVALWALTGKWGITDWRGSQLKEMEFKVIPTLHPAFILRDMSQRHKAITDLRRVAREQFTENYREENWSAVVEPSFQDVMRALARSGQSRKLVWDIETAHGHIVCIGVAFSADEAICIPFTRNDKDYWSEEEEAEIVFRLYELMRRSDIVHVFQNGLYDEQYFMEHWHFCPTLMHGNVRDTMVNSHVCFARQDKDLATQASLFCENYRFWKSDGKDWRAKGDEAIHWRYNCEDCIRTWECDEALVRAVDVLRLRDISRFQHSLRVPVLWAMRRGVLVDPEARKRAKLHMESERKVRQDRLTFYLGHGLNTKSPKQMRALFYEDMGIKPIKDRSTGKTTLGEKALIEIGEKDRILKPLVNCIREVQSIRTITSNFLDSELDPDGRMRCMFQPAGPYTYRLSSSENAFNRGGNMQNVPTHGTKSDKFKDLEVPDMRGIYVPDPGCRFWNLDLDRADLQVVVWEADDDQLKSALRNGVDMHLLAVRDVYGFDIPDDELRESHPKCREHKERYKLQRALCKQGVHATNYGASARKIAMELGISVLHAEGFQKRWFGAHPGIVRWQERVKKDLYDTMTIRNKFGYVWRVQGRPDLPEALAWIPQSTVACVINRVWVNLWNSDRRVEVLLQVHDSLAGQYPEYYGDTGPNHIMSQARIVIPYDDPLIIPATLKTGPSWGACK